MSVSEKLILISVACEQMSSNGNRRQLDRWPRSATCSTRDTLPAVDQTQKTGASKSRATVVLYAKPTTQLAKQLSSHAGTQQQTNQAAQKLARSLATLHSCFFMVTPHADASVPKSVCQFGFSYGQILSSEYSSTCTLTCVFSGQRKTSLHREPAPKPLGRSSTTHPSLFTYTICGLAPL